jgi:flagellar biogenesis protein FliO
MPRITLATMTALLFCGSVIDQQRLSGQEPTQRPSAAVEEPARQPSVQLERRGEKHFDQRARADGQGPIPIPPPKQRARGDAGAPAPATTTGNMATVVLSSLAIVLGLFFFVVWLSRRAFPKASASLSSDVLEILGRAPLASRHHLQLIRLGHRLLLVSVTADKAETLTEIIDPDEVNHLTSLCRQQQPGSITDSFRQVLHQLGSPTGTSGQQARASLDELGLVAAGERRRG